MCKEKMEKCVCWSRPIWGSALFVTFVLICLIFYSNGSCDKGEDSKNFKTTVQLSGLKVDLTSKTDIITQASGNSDATTIKDETAIQLLKTLSEIHKGSFQNTQVHERIALEKEELRQKPIMVLAFLAALLFGLSYLAFYVCLKHSCKESKLKNDSPSEREKDWNAIRELFEKIINENSQSVSKGEVDKFRDELKNKQNP